jgi:hypothetical protein
MAGVMVECIRLREGCRDEGRGQGSWQRQWACREPRRGQGSSTWRAGLWAEDWIDGKGQGTSGSLRDTLHKAGGTAVCRQRQRARKGVRVEVSDREQVRLQGHSRMQGSGHIVR